MGDIKDLKLDPDEIIVSFDVVSLFTNVPVEESILLAADMLYSGKYEEPPVDKDTFIQLARLCMKDVLMSTPHGIYMQIEGLAMGSPASPVLANLWLQQFENYFRNRNVKLFRRYVDDILCVVKKNELETILTEINCLHSSLKFTCEEESTEGEIAFLDMQLKHVGEKIESTWYTKPSSTGLLLNFYAVAPTRYKRGVVRSLVYRVFYSCSSWKLFHGSLERAKALLESNQYPESFFNPIIHDTLDTLIRKIKPKEKLCLDEQVTGKRLFFIQYRGFHTLEYIKSLQKANAPIQPILIMRKLKSVLPNLKEPLEVHLSSNIIYKLKCHGCNACYIGLTTRHLVTRANEHTRSSGVLGKHFKDCVVNTGKDIEMTILHRSNRGLMFLSILEALHIREHKPSLNKKDEYIHRPLRIRI